MNLTRQFTFAGTLAAAMAAVAVPAVPSVDTVTMAQPGPSRLVNIDYELSGADAVITLDIQTNANTSAGADDPGWTSIGGEAIGNATGEVWKKVTNDGTTHHIKWRPDLSWPDHIIANGGARAVVTAWSLDNTPNYMVVDISAGAQQNTQKYYPSADFLPGGLLGNPDYRTSRLVMRKIMAKDVEFTMGSTSMEDGYEGTRDVAHRATLTNNYYIGVFEITQDQWAHVGTANPKPSLFTNKTYSAMRPVENVAYNEFRNSAYNVATTMWPAEPAEGSFLYILNNRTGLDFDLPSEAQWEFAARAGNGDTKWGDGSTIDIANSRDANLALIGRYQYDTDHKWWENTVDYTCGVEDGTAIVGSYRPNNWGLYDMHGNVCEWCLDWYQVDITTYGGKVNVNIASPSEPLSGTSSYRAVRSGAWSKPVAVVRPGFRLNYAPSVHNGAIGVRLVCTAGLQ